jgi:hypothetical protein
MSRFRRRIPCFRVTKVGTSNLRLRLPDFAPHGQQDMSGPGRSATKDEVKVFCEARDKFLDSLSENERSRFSKCSSGEDLLAEVKAVGAFKTGHRKWERSFQCIAKFTKQLQPYFQILEIMIQSNPEWTAIAWGAFRFVLLVRLVACQQRVADS